MVVPREVPKRIAGQIVSSQSPQTDCVTFHFEGLLQVVVDLVLSPGKASIS